MEPLAKILYEQNIQNGDINEIAAKYIDPEKEVDTAEKALAGAMDIIAENISDNAEYRRKIRFLTFRIGVISVKANTEDDTVYSMYYDFSEPCSKIAPHRILAIDRGEKEKILNVSIKLDESGIIDYLNRRELKKTPSITL